MISFPTVQASVTDLPSGLTLILDPNPQAPVISVQAWVETGSIHEDKLMGSGISHLLEHMLFKGTKSYNTEELAQTVQGAGGQWNAYTSFDRTVYYIDGPSSSTETFVKVLSEMIFQPRFPKEDFESERDVIRREIDMGLDNPNSVASRQMFSTMYQVDARRHPVIGYLDLFNAVTYEDMVDYHSRRYTPDNVFFVLSGDFDPEKVTEQLAKASELAKTSFNPPPVLPEEPKQLGPRSAAKEFAIPVSKIAMSWQTADIASEDAPALDLFSTILGTGRSSRLYRQLREERQLCHSISSWFWLPPLGPGAFAVSAEVEPEKKAELQKAILEILEKAGNSITDTEIDKARRMCLVTQLKTLTTASGRASDLGSNWHEARDLNHTKHYLEKLQQLTTQDIQQAIARWITPFNLTKCSLDPLGSHKSSKANAASAQEQELEVHQLDNGIEVIIRKDDRIPMIHLCAGVLAGTPSEPKDLAGINSLLASQLTKGTETRSAEDIAFTLDSLGATLGCSSGNNTLLIRSSFLKQDLETVLPLLGDIMINPIFPEDSLELERTVQIAQVQERLEDPLGLAFYTLRKEMFSGTAYEQSSAGTPESLANIQISDLKQQLQQLINTQNMTISVFGDVDSEIVLAQLNKSLAELPSGTRFEAQDGIVQKPTSSSLSLETKQQAVVVLGYEGCSFNHEDRHALAMLMDHLGDMAGPLFTRIREELGLAYYVNGTSFQGFGTGMLGFYLGTNPDQRELAQQNLQEMLDIISANGISAEELERTRTQSLASLALQNQSNGSLAQNVVVNRLLDLGLYNQEEEIEHVKGVTHEQICAVAKKYLNRNNVHSVIVN